MIIGVDVFIVGAVAFICFRESRHHGAVVTDAQADDARV